MSANSHRGLRLVLMFTASLTGTFACVRTHELAAFPLEEERDVIRDEARSFPTIKVERTSPKGGVTVTTEVSPWLDISLYGVKVDPKQPVVPWDEVRSISMTNREQGARIGLLSGLLLGAVFGAALGSAASDCNGSIGCRGTGETAIAVGLLGAFLGTAAGALTGNRNTWSKREP